jgi:hypothetical protein
MELHPLVDRIADALVQIDATAPSFKPFGAGVAP